MYKYLLALAIPAALAAQDHAQDQGPAASYLMKLASGTSMNPQSWPMPMVMRQAGSWHLMFMGQAFLATTQQSGPRGHDKFYSTNWGMVSAQRHALGGVVQIQAMLSLEPATVTSRSYPLLFQTGETAYGRTLVDAQHPHDFVMGLGVHWARALSQETVLDVYYAPVGDPALGPVAFPHRASAMEIPQATLGHHWQDSTHIANNVVTAAVKYRWLRLEASGFYGREPNENRWNIDWGAMDSYSGRISVFPTRNWMAQFSAGRLADPERPVANGPHADDEFHGDVVRTTASLHYTRPTRTAAWSTSFIWGRNHNTSTRRDTDSYLVESVVPAGRRNYVTGRIEVVDKDELFANEHLAVHFIGADTFRIHAYTAGYTRDLHAFGKLTAGVGANLTAYAFPDVLRPYYGDRPWAATVFLKFRLQMPE
jgi:hypothetical protein